MLLAASFVLRIFYASRLYEDDGLWFTAAEEILRGKVLYREIYFDKPPLLPLIYAMLFKVFGPHILVIRLFTILYVAAVSVILYLIGKKYYGQRLGVFAACLFTFFSTSSGSGHGHVQGFNTDFLETAPYTVAAHLAIMSCAVSRGVIASRLRPWMLACLSGASAALAIQANPKGLFDLIFFAALILLSPFILSSLDHARSPESASAPPILGSSLLLIAAAALGFAATSAPIIGYLFLHHALTDYWRDVWVWGRKYASLHSAKDILASTLRFGVAYFALNSTLFIGLLIVLARTLGRFTRSRKEILAENVPWPDRPFAFDAMLLVWCAVSFLGLALGGRFYGHYFFQVLPALCLLGARGWMLLAPGLKQSKRLIRAAGVALFAVGLLVTAIRFHTRTVVLAADWIRGNKSESTKSWYYDVLNHEERMAAAVVRELDKDAADRLGLEAIRENGPRTRTPEGSSDYLFVWGYRPEIYYWSGLIPASHYLSTQPLTGVPADIANVNGQRTSLLDEDQTAAARAQLVRELESVNPNYIIDEVGMFNSELNINNFPEIAEFMKAYRTVGPCGRLMVYKRRDLKRKRRRD